MQQLKPGEGAPADIGALMGALGRKARAAGRALALSTDAARSEALRVAAASLREAAPAILAANAQDLAEAASGGAFADRLALDEGRVAALAAGLEAIAALPDPVGRVLATIERPNGLRIERVAVPLGVVGIIFESRPGVTADAGALCLKSGNAAVLRGGSESFRSSALIHRSLVAGLRAAGLPEAAISLVPVRDRAAVGAMLAGLDGNLDVVVPRGGASLVARVQAEARVPVFAHLDGNVHLFVERAADPAQARAIVHNAKLRRTGVCGAPETLLVDRACSTPARRCRAPRRPAARRRLRRARRRRRPRRSTRRVSAATEADWFTEFLDAIIAVKVVDGLDAAMAHIAHYGSHHTDGIVTEDDAAATRFLREVDSAIVLHNASTQFADGGEFGFGGEIGIATGRLHARGPVGVEQLTTFKYRVHGSGQLRP